VHAVDRSRRLPGLVAVVTAAVCLYAMRRADPDLWGYLAYGRLFVEHGVTTRDPFAYTSAPFEWVPFEYGAQILLWLAYSAAGPAGLIALKTALGGIAVYFLYVAIRATTDSPSIWLPVFVLSTSTLARFFLFRPQLFTFAGFAIFAAVLFRFLLHRRAPLWTLPPVMLLWANTHGGFVAGLGAIGLAIALEPRSRALWLTLTACVAVSFLNPLGWRTWSYVLTEIAHGTNRRYIEEWAPPSLHRDAWSAIALLTIAIALGGLTWLARHREHPRTASTLPWALSAVPLVAMSFLSVRHVPLAAIWAGPVLALLASARHASGARAPAFRRLWLGMTAAGAFAAALTLVVVARDPRPLVKADLAGRGIPYPCGTVAFLRDARIAGNLYTPLWWGSYVTWQLYPQVLVSMDGRNISLFPDQMVAENLEFYGNDPDRADASAPLRYDTDLLLIPSRGAILGRIRTDARWREIHADPAAVLFVRLDGRRAPGPSIAHSELPPRSPACSPHLQ
jgi:hypothetical protein